MAISTSLTGKNVLIVGGAGLLGKEFCFEVLESGAQVIVADINLVELSKMDSKNRNLTCLELDITSEESLAAGLNAIESKFYRLDGIVIASGVDSKVSSDSNSGFSNFENFSILQWSQELDVGLTGTFLLLKHFSKILNPGSSVVVVASDLSVISPDQRLYNLNSITMQNFKPVSYSVIKTGLIGLVRYLATYWASRNIRINAISPGGVEQDQPEHFKEALKSRIPLGRLASTNEYNKVVNFLLSDGSNYITGQNIIVDGGRSIW
jgi:NAD(P)-dependent dehydrogenase (short-subunit alcohol dehydrogenase family)